LRLAEFNANLIQNMTRIKYIHSRFQTIMPAFINIMRYFPILVSSFKNYVL